jgi:uncharacterized membrane protein
MHSNETLVAIMGMLSVFGLPVILVGIILWFKHRKLKITHETIARLAEKGLPVPRELLEPPTQNRNAALRGGLVLVGLGVALGVFFATTRGPWSIGLIPGLMGVALLIAWRIESRQDDKGSGPPR